MFSGVLGGVCRIRSAGMRDGGRRRRETRLPNQIWAYTAAFLFALAALEGSAQAATYYVSPTGNDANAGTSQTAPWATFNRAWSTIRRGDTLLLLDGVYYQSLVPSLPAPNGQWVTIRAANDGKAIIDGQGVRMPVQFLDYVESSYVILEGLVARNGTDTVYYIRKPNVIIRRCSGYNASINGNSQVFLVWTTDVLIEDSVAAGTGRMMFQNFVSQRVTLRRNFAMPLAWDGRNWCAMWWPFTASFMLYQTSNSIMENNIGYARADAFHFYLASQSDPVSGDKFLGNMALLAAREPNGSLHPKPQQGTRPTGGDNCTWVIDWDQESSIRAGFHIYPGGTLDNHLFQDNLAYGGGSVGLGFSCGGCHPFTNSTLRRMTMFGNGLNGSNRLGGATAHADVEQVDLNRFATVQDNKIDRIYSNGSISTQTGGGARLRHRYVDGTLMDGTNGQPAHALWPWPMEQRIIDELGVSVTNILAGIIPDQVTGTNLPPPPNAPSNVRIIR